MVAEMMSLDQARSRAILMTISILVIALENQSIKKIITFVKRGNNLQEYTSKVVGRHPGPNCSSGNR